AADLERRIDIAIVAPRLLTIGIRLVDAENVHVAVAVEVHERRALRVLTRDGDGGCGVAAERAAADGFAVVHGVVGEDAPHTVLAVRQRGRLVGGTAGTAEGDDRRRGDGQLAGGYVLRRERSVAIPHRCRDAVRARRQRGGHL